MISARIAPDQMRKFQGILAKKADLLHVTGQSVVKVETGRLLDTLVTITPPDDRKMSADKIQKRVSQVFRSLSEDLSFHDKDSKSGSGDVTWYAFQPNAIFGLAKDKDLRKASVDDLYQLFFKTRINKQGRIVAGKRGKQTVYIWQKLTTKASRVKQLTARFIKHLGRAKAGWAVSLEDVRDLGWKGGKPIPEWVRPHMTPGKARGYAINHLSDKTKPSFTIENHAKGIGSRLFERLKNQALRIRIQAMEKRMAYLIKHPDRIKEEL